MIKKILLTRHNNLNVYTGVVFQLITFIEHVLAKINSYNVIILFVTITK